MQLLICRGVGSKVQPHGAGAAIQLRLKTRPEIASQLPWRSDLLSCGPLDLHTEQQYAKFLLETCRQQGATTISISRLSFEDVDLATVTPKGAWEGWQDIIVEASVEWEEAPAAQMEAEPALADAAGAGAGESGGGGEFDLLAEVCGAQRSSSGKGRGKGRGKQTSQAMRQNLIAAVPHAATLQEDLDAQMQQILAEEHVLLPEADVLGPCAPLEEAVQDPAISASLDESFIGSCLEAVDACRTANDSHAAPFAESGDEAVSAGSCEADPDMKDENEDGGVDDHSDGDSDALEAQALVHTCSN